MLDHLRFQNLVPELATVGSDSFVFCLINFCSGFCYTHAKSAHTKQRTQSSLSGRSHHFLLNLFVFCHLLVLLLHGGVQCLFFPVDTLPFRRKLTLRFSEKQPAGWRPGWYSESKAYWKPIKTWRASLSLCCGTVQCINTL